MIRTKDFFVVKVLYPDDNEFNGMIMLEFSTKKGLNTRKYSETDEGPSFHPEETASQLISS